MMKKFLFIVPRFVNKGELYSFPIGMGYVVSYLKYKGFKVICLNLCHHEESIQDAIKNSIETNDVDIVCTGAMSYYWTQIEDILTTVKSNYPDKITVVGGAIITADPELAMNELPIDFGIIGEGEFTMAELAGELSRDNIQPNSVNGLIYFDGNHNLLKTKPRDSITDLDALPFPDYDALELDRLLTIKWCGIPPLPGIFYDIDQDQNMCDILASRGCPYSCTFCYHPLGKKYRQRSLDSVFSEIEYLVNKYDIKLINISDELFSLNEDRIRDFILRIKKYNLRWMAQWRVDNINLDLLKELKDSGMLVMGLGVESMSNEILKSMKKHTTKEQIDNAFKLASSIGLRAGGNLIFGDIKETEKTIKESLKWYYDHPEYNINLIMIKTVPDSDIWRYAISTGLIKDRLNFTKSSFPIINLTKIPDKIFEKYRRLFWYYEMSLKNKLKGKVLSSCLTQEMYNGKKVFKFEVVCPICKKVSTYKYYQYFSRPFTPVVCKFCLKAIRVNTGKAFKGEYNFILGSLVNNFYIYYCLYLRQIKIIRYLGSSLKRVLIRTNKNITDLCYYIR